MGPEQARKGRIPHVNLGRYRRFRREAILSWIEAKESRRGALKRHRSPVSVRDGRPNRG